MCDVDQIMDQILLILKNIHYRLYKSFDIYPSLSAEKGVTDICGAFLNFNSPKVPQKWAVFSLFGGVWRFFNYFKKSETGIDSDYVS